MTNVNLREFEKLIHEITQEIAGKTIDESLEAFLNEKFPTNGTVFGKISSLCREGVGEGWMCEQEYAGIRFGRVVKHEKQPHRFSVDVVQMKDIKGPHHVHPNGEIDMVMPIDPSACFDGQAKGWKVYGPKSAHFPTVTDGEALVLYLLPEGAIEFTRK